MNSSLSLPRPDTGRLNTAFPDTLGIVQVILIAAGILLLLRWLRTRRAALLWYLVAAGFGFILLVFAISQPFWDHISLLAYLRLPMRLRGLVALCLAPGLRAGAGAITSTLAFGRDADGDCGACPGRTRVLVSVLPAQRCAKSNLRQDMLHYEAQSGAIGTTSFGEYLPIWVQDIPNHSPLGALRARRNPAAV